jgi:peptide/nickel transport system permease protein
LIWRRFRRHKLAVGGAIVLALLALAAFGTPFFVSEEQANRLNPAVMRQPPSLAHPFGTDDIGRDIFLRAMFGGRISLRIGFLAALLSMTIGTTVGALAGYNQGWIDNVLMRITDALLSIPTLFILIVLAKVLGQSIFTITVVIGALSWMGVSRIVRANVLSLKQQDFVTSGRAIGVRPASLLFRHILPNTLAPVIVAATLGVGQAIILEASLSFLGLGVQPPLPSWGGMLGEGREYFTTAWWLTTFPGIAIMLAALSANMLGDSIRDFLDPKLRKL